MNLNEIIGLVFVLLFGGLIGILWLIQRSRQILTLREIPAFTRLARAIRLAVEDGTRVHFSLGRGDITGVQSAAAFAGLSMLERIARITSVSDHPPAVTSGDGALMILAQDTLRSTYRAMGAEAQYQPTAVRLTGLTPFSYAAGVIPILTDEMVSTDVMVGTLGSEGALIADASDRQENFSMAGSDNIPGQALLYATAQEPLIGEELYAGGAYLEGNSLHTASLNAQDIIRLLIVLTLIVGSILKLIGSLQ